MREDGEFVKAAEGAKTAGQSQTIDFAAPSPTQDAGEDRN